MTNITSKKTDVLDLIRTLTVEVERSIPSKAIMLQDIKMMNFKVRPVSGDIFSIANKDIKFVESLWKLGKIEEMVGDKIDELEDDEKDVFLNYMEDLQSRTQQEITGAISSLPKKEQRHLKMVELEIFKEKFIDKNRLN